MLSHYDVIIVGSGAGGGTMAYALARAGHNVLLLERGTWLPVERENWDARAVFQQGRYVTPDTWLDGAGKPFQPGVHYYVGGATKLYGAALYRLRPEDFGRMYHTDGVSPAWPLSYDDMEHWYSTAEWMYGVRGDGSGDWTEGKHSQPYPYPALPHEPRIQQVHDALKRVGYNPFHTPNGVQYDPRVSLLQERSCIRCATCDGFPCQRGAKADADMMAVRPALETGKVTLIRNALVQRLYTSADGREVTSVEFLRQDTGRVYRYSAPIVVLAAGAINTAALLLRSASEVHPAGLGNSSGQVGRNLMFHVSRAVMAITRAENPTSFQKTLGLNDWYLPHGDSEWPLGNIQMMGKSTDAAMLGEVPALHAAMPDWMFGSPNWPLAKIAAHSLDFWLMTEDLPLPWNRVTVTSDGKIQVAYQPTNLHESGLLYRNLRHALRKADIGLLGCVGRRMPLAAVAHQAGTARMGSDAQSSVVDVNCQAWDCPNLYIADASVFPSVGAVNPALTVMANSLRVAQHITTRLRGTA